MRYCPPPDLGLRVRSKPMRCRGGRHRHQARQRHRDRAPGRHHAPRHQAEQRAGHDLLRAGADRLRHRRAQADVEGDKDVRVSFPWSPPEVLDGRSNGSVASDVYSLGATIWHLLVGRSPFSIPGGDNSSRALTARILHAAPPATQRPDVPAALDRLLQQCLAKQPEHRPAERARAGAGAPADRAAAG